MQRSCLARPVARATLRASFASRPPDHYGVLGIRRDAQQRDVKDAFYKLSKIYHPDVNRDKVALEKFQDITAAYETLGTPESREAYDMATQPVKRLSSAAPKPRNPAGEEDYTLSYKLRKKAHEKIRIRTHPQSTDEGKRNAAPRHYAAGAFDEEKLQSEHQSTVVVESSGHTRTRAGLLGIMMIGLMLLLAVAPPPNQLKRGYQCMLQNAK